VAGLWIGRLRIAIALLLATVRWSLRAQTTQSENLRQFVSELKACVRTYAPAAQVAGVQATSDAVDFFIKACILLVRLSDLPPASADLGAVPPGMFRQRIGDERAAVMEEKRAR
jgi:hypothetical protein